MENYVEMHTGMKQERRREKEMERNIEIESAAGKRTETKAETERETETETETGVETKAETETGSGRKTGRESAAQAAAGDRVWQDELPDRDCIGKYTMIRHLGSGGEGAVYLAQDEDLHRLVAVKRLCGFSGESGAEKREAELLRQFGHPMLPVIYELLWDEAWYLVMEYIPGITLRGYIDRNGCVREDQACAWMTQLLDVTEYFHSRKPPVIYRDFKPDNIMVCPDGHLRLVDFGSAAIRNYGAEACSVMAATPGYAAPEQLGKGVGRRASGRACGRYGKNAGTGMEGRIYADERSDIYALGMILYYMVTGADPARPPYTALSIRDYQPLLSDALEKVIRKCVDDNPGHRYQMAEEVQRALTGCRQRRAYLRRRSFIRAVEKKVWLTQMQDGALE